VVRDRLTALCLSGLVSVPWYEKLLVRFVVAGAWGIPGFRGGRGVGVSGMLGLAGRRLLQLIPVAIGVTFLSFSLLNLLPGGAAIAILGPDATNSQIAQLNQALGLNKPFFVRYGLWLEHAIRGDLGSSLASHENVSSLIGQRLPVTLELVVLSVLLALVTAIPVAVISARRPMGIADWLARSTAMAALSIPGFVLALVLLLVISVKFQWLPATGFVSLSHGIGPNLRYMILPVVSLSFVHFATYTRILRSDMVDQLRTEDYVQTARSKGMGRFHVLIFHVFKNSLFSMITVVGTNLGTLIGGTVIIENIFQLPGIGQLLISSISIRDAPTVQGVVVVIAVVVVAVNFLTDMSYMVLDPRVRYGNSNR
jgi:peptide/nickel transport system permease protein